MYWVTDIVVLLCALPLYLLRPNPHFAATEESGVLQYTSESP